MKPSSVLRVRGTQSGATAIEFAFVLPLLIALTYATFVYSYVFVVSESINYAAQQGAEAAASVDPGIGNAYNGVVTAQVQSVVAGVLSWLPASQRDSAIGPNGSGLLPRFCTNGAGDASCPPANGITSGQAIVVRINFPLQSPQLFPVFSLPGIGSLPPLPGSLTGVGVALL